MKPEKQKIWEYLNRELAKVKTTADIYDRLFDNIEIDNNAFNPFFQLVLDSFTRQIANSIFCFFDKKFSWSLYQFKEAVSQSEIDTLQAMAQDFIDLRNERFAHLTRKKTVTHKNNFDFLSESGLKKANEVISEIHKLLHKVSVHYNLGSAWALQYPDIDSSFTLLLEALKSQDEDDAKN